MCRTKIHHINGPHNDRKLIDLSSIQVKSIQADKGHSSSSKSALNLLEAINFATSNGPVDWDEDLVDNAILLLQTHSVSCLKFGFELSYHGTVLTKSYLFVRLMSGFQEKQNRYIKRGSKTEDTEGRQKNGFKPTTRFNRSDIPFYRK